MMINHLGVTEGGVPLLKLPSSESLMNLIRVCDRMDAAIFIPPKWPQCVAYLNTHYGRLSMNQLTFAALVQNISDRVFEGVRLSEVATTNEDIENILNDIKNQKYGIEWSRDGDTLSFECCGHFEEWEVVHTDGNIQGLLYYDPDIEHRTPESTDFVELVARTNSRRMPIRSTPWGDQSTWNEREGNE